MNTSLSCLQFNVIDLDKKMRFPQKKNSQELLLTARDYRVHMNKKVLEIIPPYIRAHNHGVDDK